MRLYSYTVNRLHFHPGELVDALGLTMSEIEDALSELIGLKLLQHAPGRSGELTCMSPESAADLLVVPLERQVREQRRVIGRIRAQMLALAPEYEAGMAHQRRLQAVEVFSDRSARRDIIEKCARRCTSQVIVSRPGGGHDIGTLAETIFRDEQMLLRGVAMRVLYQHSARYHLPTVAYAEGAVARGAKIRTIGDRLMHMIAFDRNAVVMEMQDGRHMTVLIREPNIVEFMIASFDSSWLPAEPFFGSSASKSSDNVGQLILGLLGEGNSDKMIARRLGISERTCQRHVRTEMDRLGARSRFEAGYLIGAAYGSKQDRKWNPSAANPSAALPTVFSAKLAEPEVE